MGKSHESHHVDVVVLSLVLSSTTFQEILKEKKLKNTKHKALTIRYKAWFGSAICNTALNR